MFTILQTLIHCYGRVSERTLGNYTLFELGIQVCIVKYINGPGKWKCIPFVQYLCVKIPKLSIHKNYLTALLSPTRVAGCMAEIIM